MKTFAELFADWNENIKPLVIAQYGKNDYPALSESWNDFTDSECTDGNINDLQYHYCPAWDDETPDNDYEFVLNALGVSFDFTPVLEREDGLHAQYDIGATHYRVFIKRGSNAMSTHYSRGSSHKGEPKEADLFNCLLSDTSDIDGNLFEDWADNLGYDSDSRSAEKIFSACQATLGNLQRLFDPSELRDLREIFSDY